MGCVKIVHIFPNVVKNAIYVNWNEYVLLNIVLLNKNRMFKNHLLNLFLSDKLGDTVRKVKIQLIQETETILQVYPLRKDTILLVDSFLQLKIHLDMPWIRRCITLLHVHMALVTANAYISTLGGGHFLCRHLQHSIHLANMQMKVAKRLMNSTLLATCEIHLAYNAMQIGLFTFANRKLHRIRKRAIQRNDTQIDSMAYAAQVYLRNIYQQQTLLKSTATFTLHDDFYRQRIQPLPSSLAIPNIEY